MPPSTTITRTITETGKPNMSGVAVCNFATKNTPVMPANAAPIANASSLALDVIDAHRAGRGLVLADRHPGAADPRIPQPEDDEDQERRRAHADVVVRRRHRRRNCSRTASAPARRSARRRRWSRLGTLRDDDRHDLAEAERHDREIVAAQPQRRQAESDAEARGDQRRQRQASQNDTVKCTRSPACWWYFATRPSAANGSQNDDQTGMTWNAVRQP